MNLEIRARLGTVAHLSEADVLKFRIQPSTFNLNRVEKAKSASPAELGDLCAVFRQDLDSAVISAATQGGRVTQERESLFVRQLSLALSLSLCV